MGDCRRLLVKSFPSRFDRQGKCPEGAYVPSATGKAVRALRWAGPRFQAKDARPGRCLLSIPEQVDFQKSSIGVNADSAVAVGPQDCHAMHFQPTEDLWMRMAERTVLGD